MEQTRVDEIADGIYRISTFVADIAPPAGFTFNQFLIDAEQPALFHTGPRALFEVVRDAVATVLDPTRLRWITFGHVESDECGSMNRWLALAPEAEVAHGEMGCLLSLNDMADRPPRVLADGETLDLGGKRLRHLDTPHVPHNWEANVYFEEATGTLLCGDLFAHAGGRDALTESDIVGPAAQTEDAFMGSSLSAHAGATLRRLSTLEPRTLALMHGSSFTGDAAGALRALADDTDRRVLRTIEEGREVAAALGCPTI